MGADQALDQTVGAEALDHVFRAAHMVGRVRDLGRQFVKSPTKAVISGTVTNTTTVSVTVATGSRR
ncbi:hypothetical protein [Actinomarinicola tropica]|uniref:Uncharacterized protein n=1 Tax=Actinomarinicola tropica TaxID=2789776 RepID=A0A5Q2RLD1_9ACTN|nr:hypothetical protein [Actinomarinicola tropica]QGG93995.1 hypothetical protein GH723_02105 [Actinomarinicola tropica]